MNNLTASYILTHDQYVMFNKTSYYRSKVLWAMVALLIIFIGLFSFFIYLEYANDRGFTAKFFEWSAYEFVLIAVYLYLLWQLLVGRMRRLYKTLKESPLIDANYTYNFTPEKFASKTEKNGRIISQTEMDWNLVPLTMIYRDLILLRVAMGYYFVPKTAFKSPVEFEEFIQFLQANIKKVKICR